MTQENGKIVRISVAVVIALCLVIVASVGVPWDEGVANRRPPSHEEPVDATNRTVSSDQGQLDAANRTAPSDQERLDAPPASKSCGDFRIPGPVRYPLVVVEVVQGNVPCRVARRVMKDVYGVIDGPLPLRVRTHTGSWRCGWPETGFIMECKRRSAQETIRTRFHCRDWGPARPLCLNSFGPR